MQSEQAHNVRVGIDIGGTFTDVVAVDVDTDRHHVLKVASTPDDPIEGVVEGLGQLLGDVGWAPADASVFVHGTTIATNTLIERTGARTGVIGTHGFRDVLEVGRTERRPIDLYNLWMERPEPLAPRKRRLGVRERIDSDGRVELALDTEDVRRAVAQLLDDGVQAIAVGLINSYVNDAHEQAVADIVREMAPDVYVVCSAQVNPQYREYERLSTAVVSAYVGPKVSRYVGSLQARLRDVGVDVAVHVMQASGGVMTPDYVQRHAVRTILSGPAGGVLGAVTVAKGVEEDSFVTLDMGGTSADIAVVENGQIHRVDEHEEHGLLVRMPMLDITTIGAGGGSIAWIDSGGALKVGPMSAGAVPGPACYDLGGQDATVTDANVVLGYIDPDSYLGGTRTLNGERARQAVARLAEQLGTSIEKAALGIIRVANANMTRAIKQVTTLRGRDPRDFGLISFGGAGPLHAGSLIREMGMPRAIIPLNPGVLSACGMVSADLEYAYTSNVLERLDNMTSAEIEEQFGQLEANGLDEMLRSGVEKDRVSFVRRARLRYVHQVRDLFVEVGGDDGRDVRETMERAFSAEHGHRYGFTTDEGVELIELQVFAVSPPDRAVRFERGPDAGESKPLAHRTMVVEGLGVTEVPVFAREDLREDFDQEGPVVVEQYETNLLVLGGQRLRIHPTGVLVVEEIETTGAKKDV
jgi:N-methylhydantoinase A